MGRYFFLVALALLFLPPVATAQQSDEAMTCLYHSELVEILNSLDEEIFPASNSAETAVSLQRPLYCNIKCKDGSKAHLIRGYLSCLDLCRYYCVGLAGSECGSVSLASSLPKSSEE